MCKRVLSFIRKCASGDCYTAKVVVRHAIQHGHLRRSVFYCGLRFKFDIVRLLDPRFSYCNLVCNNYLSNVSAELSANVSVYSCCLVETIQTLFQSVYYTDDIACFIHYIQGAFKKVGSLTQLTACTKYAHRTLSL